MATGINYLDYFLFVFIASVGTLQIAASYAQLRGLSFFNRSIAGYISGSLTVVLAFWWFFASEKRVGHCIIEGFEQFQLLIAGVATAIIVTITLASIIKSRKLPCCGSEETGLESLKYITHFQVITRYFRKRGNKS